MPQDLIQSYKSTGRLCFSDDALEQKFTEFCLNRGKSSSVYAFLTLALLSFTFAYIEYFALAIESYLPMQLFIAAGVFSVINGIVSLAKIPAPYIRIRILLNSLFVVAILIYTIIGVKYRLYYALEATLFIVWFSIFSTLKLRLAILANLAVVGAFVGAMQLSGESIIKVIIVTCYLFSAMSLGVFLAYLWERMRRMLFMTNDVMNDISARQEIWAYTLIDLDMALSGIHEFKDLLERVLEYLGTVITFESSVITSLEGQGPKPEPLKVSGELFENEDKTIWNDDLMSKLEQTRQAYNSDFYTEKKGFLGKKIKQFQHFRLDVPIFNEFNLVGIISLRREHKAFDDLDMTASVSLVSQAMLIYNRSQHTQNIQPTSLSSVKEKQVSERVFDEDATDLPSEITDLSNSTKPIEDAVDTQEAEAASAKEEVQKKFLQSSPNLNLAPKIIQDAFKKKDTAAKKSLVILSRENADKISVDKYRTAIIDGNALSFMIMEIDGLSSIREKDGDKVAYRVFSGIAKQLFAKLDKEKHIVGRYGKNGISILMPGVDMNAAEKFAENFRQFVEEEKYKTVYGTRTATLSVGVAAVTDDTGEYASMMKRADMALFVAKKNGRNCVKVRL